MMALTTKNRALSDWTLVQVHEGSALEMRVMPPPQAQRCYRSSSGSGQPISQQWGWGNFFETARGQRRSCDA
jgi:hypothetical protein